MVSVVLFYENVWMIFYLFLVFSIENNFFLIPKFSLN